MHRQPRVLFRSHFKNFWVFIFILWVEGFFVIFKVDGLPQNGVFNANQKLSTISDCASFSCSTGSMCFLEEEPCDRFPCPLNATCATNEVSQKWLDECRELGCASLDKCFLRVSYETCQNGQCVKVPDCLDHSEFSPNFELFDESKSAAICHGWVCPPNSRCAVKTNNSCMHRHCESYRFCTPQNYEELRSDEVQLEDHMDFENQSLIEDLDNLRSQNVSAQHHFHDKLEQNSKVDFEKDPLIQDLENLKRSTVAVMIKPRYETGYTSSTKATLDKSQPTSAVKTKRLSEFPNIRRKFTADSSYMKHIAGHKIVQLWIDKSKTNNHQDYEEFLNWMSLVENLLEPELYRLWLEKVTIATSDVPEFQSWLSLRNLDEHRSSSPAPVSRRRTPKARSFINVNAAAAADISLPNSINLRAKNLFYSDKNFIFVDPNSNSNNQPSFIDKQAISSILDHQGLLSKFDRKNQQQMPMQSPPPVPQQQQMLMQNSPPLLQKQQTQYQIPQNFNFNEPKRFNEPPSGFRYEAPQPPYPTVPYFNPVHSHPDQDYIMPDLRRMPMMRLPGGFVRSPEPPEYSDINSYYLSNYTQIQNISFTASPNYDTHQQHNRQPRFFFPNGQIDFGKSIQSNQWTEHWSNSLPLKRDSQPAPHEPDHNQEEAPLALGVDTMISELSGLQQLKNLKPNVIKLDPSQPVSQMVLPSDADRAGQMPNLLIYFPPPLNFFMYYSVKNQTERKITTTTTTTTVKRTTTQSTSQTTRIDVSEEDEDDVGLRMFPGEDTEPNKPKKIDKYKELEYIRKIIKELIDYWDEKEKSLESSRNKGGEPCDDKKLMQKVYSSPEKPTSSTKSLEEATTVPSFNAFLDWLNKNSDKKFAFSDRDLQNKRPADRYESNEGDKPIDEESSEDVGFRSFSEDTSKVETRQKVSGTPEKKIRILVDIDKNPDLIKLLFANNKLNTNNSTDTNEYQIIVNLDEFVKPNEEDLISRRLIDIATNQLHRNVTDEKKIPKILWVFPIYDDEEDDTLINEFERKSKERINNARDGNAPKRNRHHNQSDKRATSSDFRMTTPKPKSSKNTEPQEDDYEDKLGDETKDDDYDNNYEDQSYYDQQDQKSGEDISREDS